MHHEALPLVPALLGLLVSPCWGEFPPMHAVAILQKPVHLQLAHIPSEMDEEPGPIPRPSLEANGVQKPEVPGSKPKRKNLGDS